MRIHACFCLIPFLLLSRPVRADLPPASDAFLDQPIGVTEYMLKGYSGQLSQMQKIVSKPIVVPNGVVDFVASVNKGYFVTTTGIGEGPDASKETNRNFLNMACPSLGMAWNYNPSRDIIVLDFPWRRNDPRTTQQLLDLLLPTGHPQAINGNEFTSGGQTYRLIASNDSWPIIFDALLSKPGNFSNAWKVRLADDLRRASFFARPVEHLLTARMKDEQGAEHVLIVNSQPEFCNPGPVGSISYYVFDLHGKFEQGGLCSIGYRCMDASVWLDPSGKQLILRVFNNGSYRIDERFALTKNGLIIGDVIDNTGAPMTGSRLMGTCYGLPLLHVSN
jgi:hypothetical protein